MGWEDVVVVVDLIDGLMVVVVVVVVVVGGGVGVGAREGFQFDGG